MRCLQLNHQRNWTRDSRAPFSRVRTPFISVHRINGIRLNSAHSFRWREFCHLREPCLIVLRKVQRSRQLHFTFLAQFPGRLTGQETLISIFPCDCKHLLSNKSRPVNLANFQLVTGSCPRFSYPGRNRCNLSRRFTEWRRDRFDIRVRDNIYRTLRQRATMIILSREFN